MGLRRDQIPAIATADGKGVVNLISGEWDGHTGPIKSLTGVFMTTVRLASGGRVSFPDVSGRNVFLYVVNGTIRIAGDSIKEHVLVELDAQGDTVAIEATSDATLLFGHAQPIGEPVVAHGPFVMNTPREIEDAIRDYHAGKFGPLE